jgi:ankyrin repeat protein
MQSQIDFVIKTRIGGEIDAKKQKKIYEDIQKGNLDKVKEKTTKTMEFNFLIEGGTICSLDNPMATATMNNDTEMMIWLMDNGAYLDYRVGDKDQWKTPLHLAAVHNKTSALKTLIQFGAWVDAKDTLGLTPLYYACMQGNTECVLRLLLAKADTEIFDENGRGPLHLVSRTDLGGIE